MDDQAPSPPKKRTTRPEPESSGKSNKRRKTDAKSGDRVDSDDEPEVKKAKKSGSTSKVKLKEIKVVKVSKSETKKLSIKSKASGKTPKPAVSAVRLLYCVLTQVTYGPVFRNSLTPTSTTRILGHRHLGLPPLPLLQRSRRGSSQNLTKQMIPRIHLSQQNPSPRSPNGRTPG